MIHYKIFEPASKKYPNGDCCVVVGCADTEMEAEYKVQKILDKCGPGYIATLEKWVVLAHRPITDAQGKLVDTSRHLFVVPRPKWTCEKRVSREAKHLASEFRRMLQTNNLVGARSMIRRYQEELSHSPAQAKRMKSKLLKHFGKE